MAWHSGNGFDHISKLTLRRQAQLVLIWVTVLGYAFLVRNQPLGSTRPPNLSRTGNEYRPWAVAGKLAVGLELRWPCITQWGVHWRHLANTIEPSLCGISVTYGLIVLRKGDQHPAFTSVMSMAAFTYLLLLTDWRWCR